MNDNIRKLQEAIEAEKRKISNCSHTYGEAYYNPEEVTEGYGSRVVQQGVDFWTEPEGYHTVKKPRWTRKCSKCGYENHTTKTTPIIVGHKPEF